MKSRTFLPIVVVLFAAFALPSAALAQTASVRPPNKNQSARFKSGIFKGSGNLIQSNSITSFIGGGQSNSVVLNVRNAVIGGGFGNVASNDFGAVVGGLSNSLTTGGCNAIGGGRFNSAGGGDSVVGGGLRNSVEGPVSAIGGGSENTNSGLLSFIGGGWSNTVASDATNSFLGAGVQNIVSGSKAAAVVGGEENTASGNGAFVGGGFLNTASGVGAVIAGGGNNIASAPGATVPGGVRGQATHEGSFVWGSDVNEDTKSWGKATFTVRCEGGASFYTASGTSVGPRLGPGDPQWVSSSDSNLKTRVSAVNAREILAKLSRLPVTEWEYKHNPNRRYIGPMAQDFHALFGLGHDDKGIGTLDSDGVMYASIKGLVEELKDRDKAIEELKAKNSELSRSIEAINERLNSLPPAP